jgi:hypothetical protein
VNAAIREMQEGMERHGYIAEHSIATAVYLAKEMRKPLLIEGDAGVARPRSAATDHPTVIVTILPSAVAERPLTNSEGEGLMPALRSIA